MPSPYYIAWLMPSAMTSGLAARSSSSFGLAGRLRDIASPGQYRPLRQFQSLSRLARLDSFSQWAVSSTVTVSVAGPPSPLRHHSVAGPSRPWRRIQSMGRLARRLCQSLGRLTRCDVFSRWAISPTATLSVAGPFRRLRLFQSLGRLARCDAVSRWDYQVAWP